MALEIKRMTVGPLMANCYLLIESETKEAFIVDPGAEGKRILEWIEQEAVKPIGIILTHAHGDHIGATTEVKEGTNVPVMVHQEEADWLTDSELNLSYLLGIPVTAPAADRFLEDGQTLEIGSETLQVMHTPGHSPGGIVLYQEGSLICGDLIFQASVGRTDLPGGSTETLLKSIKEKVLSLPDDTQLYPGHGDTSTVGQERFYNPFLR